MNSGQACRPCRGSCSLIPERGYFGDHPGDEIVVSPPSPIVEPLRRVSGGKRIEALGDLDIGVVDVEPLQFHCSSNVVVPGDMVGGAMKVGTVLDSRSCTI